MNLGTAASFSALVALIVPLIVAVVARCNWPSAAKGATAAGVSIIVGAGSAYFAGAFTGLDVMACIVVAITAAQSSYAMFWKPTGASAWIMDHLGNTDADAAVE